MITIFTLYSVYNILLITAVLVHKACEIIQSLMFFLSHPYNSRPIIQKRFENSFSRSRSFFLYTYTLSRCFVVTVQFFQRLRY